ncbi:hypothetical protein B0H13DRAFT_2510781 [Mycena leptocephala]|nr:hypothetical protein B0H13DRAFT_2510781 [Mycena leptocephala]
MSLSFFKSFHSRHRRLNAGRFSVRVMHGGRRPAGIGLLAGVILTPPGKACDYVLKTPQPLFPRAQWDAAQDAYGYDSAESYDSCAAALTDIETGHIGGPSYKELAITAPPPAHVPGAANESVPETSMPNGSWHAPAPAPPPRRKSSRGSRGRRRDDQGGAHPTRSLPPDGTTAAAAPVVLALLDREAHIRHTIVGSTRRGRFLEEGRDFRGHRLCFMEKQTGHNPVHKRDERASCFSVTPGFACPMLAQNNPVGRQLKLHLAKTQEGVERTLLPCGLGGRGIQRICFNEKTRGFRFLLYKAYTARSSSFDDWDVERQTGKVFLSTDH